MHSACEETCRWLYDTSRLRPQPRPPPMAPHVTLQNCCRPSTSGLAVSQETRCRMPQSTTEDPKPARRDGVKDLLGELLWAQNPTCVSPHRMRCAFATFGAQYWWPCPCGRVE